MFKRAPAEWEEIRGSDWRITRTWFFEIMCLYSVKDSKPTATDFESMVENVLNKLSLSPSSGDNSDLAQPASLINLDEVMFSSILCHRAQIEYATKEYLNPASP
jgi:hypothetical protein